MDSCMVINMVVGIPAYGNEKLHEYPDVIPADSLTKHGKHNTVFRICDCDVKLQSLISK